MKTKNLIAQLCACLALCAISFTARAQIIIPSMPDTVAGPGGNTQNVNCDLAEFIMSNGVRNEIYTLAAFTWDNAGATTVTGRINLRGYSVGGSVTAIIPAITSASRPDIIIGHTKPSNWYAVVIYEQGKQIKMNRYTLTLSGSPLSVTVGSPTTTTLSTVGNIAEWPHIDGYSDPSAGLANNCFPVPEYVASWQETISGVVTLKGIYGTIFPVSINSVTMITSNAVNIINSDVAAYTDYTSSTKTNYASFVYSKVNGTNQDLYVESFLRAGGPAPTITLETAQKLQAARIESPSWDPINTGTGLAGWMASCPKLTLSGNYEVFEYNALTTPPSYNVSAAFGSGSYTNAAIGACIGVNGVIGASTFWWARNSIIMHAANSANIELSAVLADGNTTSSIPVTFDVNLTPITTPVVSVPIATSGSSTTGNHRLVAWYNAPTGMVKYKITYDSAIHFRPTAVNNITTAGNITLYPNPTSGNIMLSGITKADYTIVDALGRNLGTGVALEGHSILTSWLPAGTYYLQVNEEGKKQSLRFIKQ